MTVRLVKGSEEIKRLDSECFRLDAERKKAAEQAARWRTVADGLRSAGNSLSAEFCQWCPHEHRRPFLDALDSALAAYEAAKKGTT